MKIVKIIKKINSRLPKTNIKSIQDILQAKSRKRKLIFTIISKIIFEIIYVLLYNSKLCNNTFKRSN